MLIFGLYVYPYNPMFETKFLIPFGIFCFDIIPKEYHTKEFFDKIVAIEAQEDIWFDRLDRKKENTFEIVCLKKYLYENEDKKD